MSVSFPGFVPVLMPLLGGADVLRHQRLAGPYLPEVLTPLAECQAVVAARRLIQTAEVVPVVLPRAHGADVPRPPLLQREVIAARALKRFHRPAPPGRIHERCAAQAATGNPLRSILAQNCDQRSVVYDKHLKLSTAAAPGSVHLIPDPHSRCFTSTLHAASVTPLPIGTLATTSGG